ncbi:MAG: hypothetical protein ACQES1_10115 [Bacteroidota bacterium]
MENHFKLLGILVREPEVNTTHLQDILTSYGCNIRTRLGLNGPETKKNALILLELYGDEQEQKHLTAALKELPGLEIQSMQF